MGFAISGSHRSGKTTLARQVAEDLGWAFHDASVSKIMREAGMDGVSKMPIEQRIEAQEFLLKRFVQDLTRAPRPMITDRTPLDMIAYTLGEVTMHNTDPKIGERIDDYMHACIDATIQQFDTIMIVRPLRSYVVDAKSPPMNLAYQSHIQMLIEGAAQVVDPHIYTQVIHPTDFEERRAIAKQHLSERLATIQRHAQLVNRH